MNSLYLDLYHKRYYFDCNAQPKFLDHYVKVDKDLKTHFMKDDCHPYEVRPDTEFTSNICYINGDDTWYSGHISKKDKYLYRIDNLYKLLHWNQKNIVNKSNLRKKYKTRKFNSNLLDQSEIPSLFNNLSSNSKTWLPLSDLLIKYETPRQITWWTNENMAASKDPNVFMGFAHKLGLATNWINNYSVIVRCNIGKLSKIKPLSDIKVPTVIDAYNSPIFFPQSQAEKPRFGLTINLKNIGSLGCKEYIIREVILESLDFQIVKIPDEIKTANTFADESEELYEKIISLYM